MIKKIVLILLLVAAATAGAAGVAYRKAPGFLRQSLTDALGKTVRIRDVRYRFPATFRIEGFEILEGAPFEGETAFSVSRMNLTLAPMAALKGRLVVRRAEVDGAEVVLRKSKDRFYHALSEAIRPASNKPALPGSPDSPSPDERKERTTLVVREFVLNGGQFRFVDYDVQEGGFVVEFSSIRALVHDASLPPRDERTSYRVNAELVQGRDRVRGKVELQGVTRFDTLDGETRLDATGIQLPYFKPYASRVTPADIREGELESRAAVEIRDKKIQLSADLTLTGLLFQDYEAGEELFGMKADEILSFMKDSAGRLKLSIRTGWNLADPSVKASDVMRRAIGRSLKATVVGNAGTLLHRAIQKYGEVEQAETPNPSGMPETDENRERLEDAFDKVKGFFD